jgi:hypothetical protein
MLRGLIEGLDEEIRFRQGVGEWLDA